SLGGSLRRVVVNGKHSLYPETNVAPSARRTQAGPSAAENRGRACRSPVDAARAGWTLNRWCALEVASAPLRLGLPLLLGLLLRRGVRRGGLLLALDDHLPHLAGFHEPPLDQLLDQPAVQLLVLVRQRVRVRTQINQYVL